MGNKVLKNDDLRQIFNDNDSGLIVDNFEFVYLPNHANQELLYLINHHQHYLKPIYYSI